MTMANMRDGGGGFEFSCNYLDFLIVYFVEYQITGIRTMMCFRRERVSIEQGDVGQY